MPVSDVTRPSFTPTVAVALMCVAVLTRLLPLPVLSQDDTAAAPTPSATAQPAPPVVPLLSTDVGITCSSNVESVAEQVQTLAQDTKRHVRAIIATVPDPLDSTIGWFVDDQLGAIEQAMNASGFVLHCYSLPWTEQSNADDGKDTAASVTPGVVVAFAGERDDPLVMFLVGETPTTGIHAAAFERAVGLITRFKWFRGDDIDILGPTFSGSASSLRLALQRHADRPFRIISGSAMREQTKRDLESAQPHVRYNVVVHSSTALMDALVTYLTDHHVDLAHTALLYESGTLYGHSLASRRSQENTKRAPRFQIPFPLQISRVRSADEHNGNGSTPKSKAQAEQSTQNTKSVVGLTLRDAIVPRDRIPPMRPDLATVSADLVLSTILTTLADAQVTHVLIVATDPRDTLFLARRIREYVPDVQLATFSSDLLYVHHDWRADVEGMIVASTYPLIATVQQWQGPTDVSQILQFTRNAAEGAYNATLALLQPNNPPLVDYASPPFGPLRSCDGKPGPPSSRPPVWLTLVAHDRFLPIQACNPRDADAVLPGAPPPAARSVRLPFPLLASTLIVGMCVLVVVLAAKQWTGIWPLGRQTWWLNAQLALCWLGVLAAAGAILRYLYKFTRIYWEAGAGDASLDDVLVYMRGTDIGTGRSLLLLVVLIAAVFWIVALCHLRRLRLVRTAALWNPLGAPGTSTADLSGTCDEISRTLRGYQRPPPGAIVGYLIVGFAGFLVLRDVRLENGKFDDLVRVLLIAAFVLVTLTGLHSVVLWMKTSTLLRRLAAHPLVDAYARLRADPITRGLRSRFYGRTPALYEVGSLLAGWRALRDADDALPLDAAKLIAPSDTEAGVDLAALATVRGEVAAVAEAETAFDAEFGSGDVDVARTDEDAACGRCYALATALVPLLDRIWRQAPDAKRKADRWLAQAEELVARTVVMYLAVLFTHLQNLLTMLVAGAFLLVFIVLSYPFQPQSRLTTAAWIFIAGVIATVLTVLVQMDRSHVLNQLSDTASGQLTFDRNLFGMVSRYVVLPLTGLVATQIPGLGRFVDVIVRYLR